MGLSLTVAENSGSALSNRIAERTTSKFFIEDPDSLKTFDHHYLLSKYSDACVVFSFWKATESIIFMDQALQDIVNE